MVIHWNAAGQPDGWAPRAFAAWFGWATAAGTYLLLKVLPSIDPRRANYPGSQAPTGWSGRSPSCSCWASTRWSS
ncbi:DUF1648 domain-containing protein [Thermaerobacter sp. FW80]|uniref:DUF1648 domain-containing protein n=1 Tax=Thermaerobacter sp. FW80 TaxID=2546351 RepID=UPI00352A3DE2